MLFVRALGPLTLAVVLSGAPPPGRIVSTAPGLTEILFDLGLGPNVVGVTSYCRYPPEARHRAVVGSFLEPNLERIAALRPDLVLIIKNPVRLGERLRALRLNVLEVDPLSMPGVFQAYEAIGKATGREEAARRRAADLRAQLEAIRRASAARPPKSVLFLVGRTPGTLDGLYGAGRGTYLDELLRLAGGSNILAGAPVEYPKISLETLAVRDPEVIIDMGDAAHAESGNAETEEQVKRLWREKMPRLRAVREGHLYRVADDIFVVPGPRMVEAARRFQHMLAGAQ